MCTPYSTAYFTHFVNRSGLESSSSQAWMPCTRACQHCCIAPQQAEVPEYSYCSSPHVCTTHATTFEDSTKCICVCAVRDMAAQLSCNKVVQRLPSANHACILWLATPSRVSPPIGIITLAPLSGHIAHPEPNNIISRPQPILPLTVTCPPCMTYPATMMQATRS